MLAHEQPLQMEREEHNHDLFAKKVVDVVGNSLVPSTYDYVSLTYTGSNITTAVFKMGGSGGTTVSTLSLTYDGSGNLLTVTKA